MTWIVAMVIAAFFIGWIGRGFKLKDDTYDAGFDDGYGQAFLDILEDVE